MPLWTPLQLGQLLPAFVDQLGDVETAFGGHGAPQCPPNVCYYAATLSRCSRHGPNTIRSLQHFLVAIGYDTDASTLLPEPNQGFLEDVRQPRWRLVPMTPAHRQVRPPFNPAYPQRR
ncbi:hypothetical protein WP39_29810 [Streptomyces sp. 604F]|nr:hypothetical protein [Streptomyces sp. 604F]